MEAITGLRSTNLPPQGHTPQCNAMETPLTPLDFARRAVKLHARREAVVDGDVRLTYAQFGERCDRWSAGLAALGIEKGDRVATIAPNTHQHLEQFFAIPQRGAVIVPMNYRLSADDFVYMATHSGAKMICAHADYLDSIDRVRAQMPTVRHFVALEGERPGWLAYESLLQAKLRVQTVPTKSSKRTCSPSIIRAVPHRARKAS